jgi:hydroxypyruvate reductase
MADPSIPLKSITEIIQAALQAADPYQLVLENLEVGAGKLRVGEKYYSLEKNSQIIIVGLGKASLAMVQAAESKLGSKIDKGVCVCKHNPDQINFITIEVVESSHPIPDQRSVIAARKIKRLVSGLTPKDIVVFLLSGGGSALACLPAEGIFLEDIQRITSSLLKSGASINEINTVRKHLDEFKGGGFLEMVQPSRLAVLVLSDVIGSPLDVIASGPTIKDPSTYADALEILLKYLESTDIPANIVAHINEGIMMEEKVTENQKNQDKLTAYHKVIGSNVISVDAASQRATELGFNSKVLTYSLQGEARNAHQIFMDFEIARPFALFAGGETTVTVRGNGLGGRNLEFALGAVETISRMEDIVLVTFATDGEDGPTDAAGAIVSSNRKVDSTLLAQCLENNDAYSYFQKVGGLIKTGPSGTNVNDISFVIGY